jgi:hypothetical protein
MSLAYLDPEHLGLRKLVSVTDILMRLTYLISRSKYHRDAKRRGSPGESSVLLVLSPRNRTGH